MEPEYAATNLVSFFSALSITICFVNLEIIILR